jgi:hypothetical protein
MNGRSPRGARLLGRAGQVKNIKKFILTIRLKSFGFISAYCLRGKEKSTKMNKTMRNEPNLGQSQIAYNGSCDKQLRRKNEIRHLFKTNPNEPNLVPSAVEGSIKMASQIFVLKDIYGIITSFMYFLRRRI